MPQVRDLPADSAFRAGFPSDARVAPLTGSRLQQGSGPFLRDGFDRLSHGSSVALIR